MNSSSLCQRIGKDLYHYPKTRQTCDCLTSCSGKLYEAWFRRTRSRCLRGFEDEREVQSTNPYFDVNNMKASHEEAYTRVILHVVESDADVIVIMARHRHLFSRNPTRLQNELLPGMAYNYELNCQGQKIRSNPYDFLKSYSSSNAEHFDVPRNQHHFRQHGG